MEYKLKLINVLFDIRQDFLYLLDYVTCWSEKLRFQTKRICLKPQQNCLFLVSSEIIEKIIIPNHHSTLVNHTKIMINGVHFFFFFFVFVFSDRRSEKISWYNILQQINPPSPKPTYANYFKYFSLRKGMNKIGLSDIVSKNYKHGCLFIC